MERYPLEVYRLIVDLNQTNTYAEIANQVKKKIVITEPLEPRHVATILKRFKAHGYKKANYYLKDRKYEVAYKISVGIEQKIPERNRGRRVTKSENDLVNNISSCLANVDQK